MDKKDLKFYESPVMEAIGLEVKTSILAGSGEVEGVDDQNDITGGNDNPGF